MCSVYITNCITILNFIIFRNGQPYSYCGLTDTEVCCFIDFDRYPEGKDHKNVSVVSRGKVNRNSTRRPTSPSTSTTTLRTAIARKSQTKPTRKFSVLPSQEQSIKSLDSDHIDEGECGVPKIEGNLDSIARFKEWPWHVSIKALVLQHSVYFQHCSM